MGSGASTSTPLETMSTEDIAAFVAGVGKAFADYEQPLLEEGYLDGTCVSGMSAEDLEKVMEKLSIRHSHRKELTKRLEKAKHAISPDEEETAIKKPRPRSRIQPHSTKALQPSASAPADVAPSTTTQQSKPAHTEAGVRKPTRRILDTGLKAPRNTARQTRSHQNKTTGKVQASTLLFSQKIDRGRQAEELRIVLPGVPQLLLKDPDVRVKSTTELIKKIRKQFKKAVSSLDSTFTEIEIHIPRCQLGEASYRPLSKAVDMQDADARKIHLRGGKVRFCAKKKGTVLDFVQVRAVRLRELERFNQQFPGNNSRIKQELLMEACKDDLSWVEWDAQASKHAGPPDVMISYSWDLDWRYMIAYLKAFLEPDVRVWVDILACSQHNIARGEMNEIMRLPEVVNYAGKTLIMPGTVKRLWCLYEFAWSVDLNGGCMFYGFGADDIKLDDKLKTATAALATDDAALLQEKQLLANAKCFKQTDEDFIRETIANRLGGIEQVTFIIKLQLQATLNLELDLAPIIPAQASQQEFDKCALFQLFVSANGPGWKHRLNWCAADKKLKCWHGVKTDKDGIVTSIDLRNNGLVGKLPFSILDMSRQGVGIQVSDNEALDIEPKLHASIRKISPLRLTTMDPDTFAEQIARGIAGHTLLTSLDLSGNNIGPDGAKALADAIKQCPALIDLDISDNNLGSDGAKAFAGLLPKCKLLTNLDISDNNLGSDGAKAFAEVLPKCKALIKLNISHNALTYGAEGWGDMTGVQALAEALPKTVLIDLDISKNDIGPDVAKAFAEALPKCKALIKLKINECELPVQEIKTATELDLSNKKLMLTDAIIISALLPLNEALIKLKIDKYELPIQEIKTTTELDLSKQNLQPTDAIVIAALLPLNQALIKLDISDNQLTGKYGGDMKGVLALAEALPKTALNSVDILGNNIGEEQANNLIQLLDTSDTLTTLCGFTGTETELDLSNRKLSASCAILVANEVKVNRALIKLDISNNKVTQGEWNSSREEYKKDMSGVKALAEALPETALIKFTFSGDRYYDGEWKDAPSVPLEAEMTEVDISNKHLGASGAIMAAAFLPKMMVLIDLDISKNDIGPDVAKAFAGVLPKCKALTKFNISGNAINAKGAKALAGSIKKCSALAYLDVSDNIPKYGPGSTDGPAFARAIADGIKDHPALTSITFDGTGYNAKAVKLESSMVEVDLRGKGLGLGGAQIAAAFLPKMTLLTSLDISKNNLGSDGAKAFAEVLPKCKELIKLDIWGNNLTNYGQDMTGVQALAAVLPETALINLDISSNDLAHRWKFPNDPPTEKTRDHPANYEVDISAVVALSEAIKGSALIKLKINQFELPIQDIKTATELDLSNKMLGVEDAVVIAALLPLNEALMKLDISSNSISRGILDQMKSDNPHVSIKNS